MSKLLLFMILAARNSDGEDTGWSQLLVFIVLAVFWSIGGIMKARAEKTKQQKGLDRDKHTMGHWREEYED